MEEIQSWHKLTSQNVQPKNYLCGYCSKNVSSSIGDYVVQYTKDATGSKKWSDKVSKVSARRCPNCKLWTQFDSRSGGLGQVPGFLPLAPIEHLPQEVEGLYEEARRCYQARAFTACAHVCRKLLMNTAAHCGAPQSAIGGFFTCVNYLETANILGINMRVWIDRIRKIGNEAAHEIKDVNESTAMEPLRFTEMMLKNVYEMPNSLPQEPPA